MVKDDRIIAILETICLLGMVRDHAFERILMLLGKLEIYIRNKLHLPDILSIIQGRLLEDRLLCGDGRVAINRHAAVSCDCSHPDVPLDAQIECQPLITELVTGAGGIQGEWVLNGSPLTRTPFLMVRLAHQCWSYAGRFSHQESMPQQGTLPCLADMDTATFLGKKLNISDSWDEPVNLSSGLWHHAFLEPGMTYDSNARVIRVRDEQGIWAYALEVLIGFGQTAVIPVAFFQHPEFPRPLRLPSPPSPPYPLLGAERLALFPEAIVFLSDEIGTCENGYSQEFIFISVPGGEATFTNTKWSVLNGRRVVWLLLDQVNETEPMRKYKVALKIAQISL